MDTTNKSDKSFCILISCMFQDKDIINRSNVRSNVVVVNQCDTDSQETFVFTDAGGDKHHALFINTTERGLSKSRNMAVKNSLGDICLICDDDELFVDDVENIVLEAYSRHPECDVISFSLKWKELDINYPMVELKMGVVRIQKTSSQQISFRKSSLANKCVCFDEKMGSGTGNGGGEENMLLNDCRRSGMNMLYVPKIIATILSGESKWFSKRDEKWFENLGWVNRRIHGLGWGLIYVWFWLLAHLNIKRDTSVISGIKAYYSGVFAKR